MYCTTALCLCASMLGMIACQIILVSLSPPLVGLCRIWVDVDRSVTVSLGSIGFLHPDVNTSFKKKKKRRRKRLVSLLYRINLYQ